MLRKIIISIVLIVTALFVFQIPVLAQGITLAVTPPILEVMIAPGKEITYEFTVSSLDSNVVLTPRIVSFFPADIYGDSEEGLAPPPQFVTLENSQAFSIPQGGKNTIKVKVAPPSDSPEQDYYLRLVFETGEPENVTDQNTSQAKVKIASNILITVSKDGQPKKRAEIVKFDYPKVVDSFFPIRYSIVIENIGNSFFKPIGKVGSQTLAPQNILSGYQRQIPCLDQETLVECKASGKFHIGLVKSHLEFTLDDSPELYESDAQTIAFPFILMGLITFIYALFKIVPIDKIMGIVAKSR